MKKFLTFILVAIMMLAVIVAASEDADGKLVPKVTFPALAVATLCGLGLNRLVREEKTLRTSLIRRVGMVAKNARGISVLPRRGLFARQRNYTAINTTTLRLTSLVIIKLKFV